MSREEDKRVAEILGWTDVKQISGDYGLLLDDWSGRNPVGKPRFYGDTEVFYPVPEFTSDPTADYQALKWICMNYGGEDEYEVAEKYRNELYRLWHGLLDPLFYKPGDYSRALLELDKKGLLK